MQERQWLVLAFLPYGAFKSIASLIPFQLHSAFNGIRYLADSVHDIAEIFYGRNHTPQSAISRWRELMDAESEKEAHREHPWVGPFYDELSD
jgi:hypothetical protein